MSQSWNADVMQLHKLRFYDRYVSTHARFTPFYETHTHTEKLSYFTVADYTSIHLIYNSIKKFLIQLGDLKKTEKFLLFIVFFFML
jgi:hypothetical protein